MNDERVIVKKGRLLPHWTQNGAIYHVVFRLKDSLPSSTLKAWRADKFRLQKSSTLTKVEKAKLQFYVSKKSQEYLDQGEGSCLFKEERFAKIVQDALFFFNTQRYLLHAFSIMPNHVHVIVEPYSKHNLSEITHSWKSYSSHEICKLLKTHKQLWQHESFDHIIRDEKDYENAMDYVVKNPSKANLIAWLWIYDSRNA